jgi:hypothetical protein
MSPIVQLSIPDGLTAAPIFLDADPEVAAEASTWKSSAGHRGVPFGDYDYTAGNFSVVIDDKGSFLNKWANRGEAAYLDFLVLNEPPPSESRPTPAADQPPSS